MSYDLAQLRLSGFGRRFLALLLDWALCMLVASFYANPQQVPWPPVVVLIVLNTVLIGLFGRTAGMAVTGVRCLSYTDSGAIGLPRAFVRAVLLALLIPALVMDGDRRGWHDRAAGSVVLEKVPAAA